MRVMMVMKWAGFTAANYETIRKTVNWEGNHPKGAVFHVAAFTPEGGRVTDIWESEADLNNFLKDRLMPGVANAGIKGEPQVEVYPVHAIFAPALQRVS